MTSLACEHSRFTFENISCLAGYRLMFLLLEKHRLNNLPRVLLPLLKHSTCHLCGILCILCIRLSQKDSILALLIIIKLIDSLINLLPFI